jgi:hypothetical protein
LCGVLSWYHTGGTMLAAALGLAACVCQSLCIVATRKHYTVDVVLAWILCPLLLSYLVHSHATL